MKNYIILGVVLFLSFTAVAAMQERVPAVSQGGATVVIPEHAVLVAPGVYSLGAVQYEGKTVEGYAFVHYKKEPARPSRCDNDGICEKGEDSSCGDCGAAAPTCYGYISKGAKWRSAEPYVINTANSQGLDGALVAGTVASGIAKWETAASADIVGAGNVTDEALVEDTKSPDGRNEVLFGSIADSNAIAITIVWGVFRGPESSKQLIEWDQVYDQADFAWSSSGEAGKMDFENIATHELGHTVGMGDLYTGGCSEETMYGYASEGETKKRTLGTGDVAGVKKLYGG